MPPSLRPGLASALAELALRELAQAGFGRTDVTGRSEAAVLADALGAPAAVLALDGAGRGPFRVAASACWDGLPDTFPVDGVLGAALARSVPVDLRPVPGPLAASGVAAGLAVRIGTLDRPFALAVVMAREPRRFDDDERAFLGAAAAALHARFALDDTRRALTTSEERFRALVESTAHVVWTADPDGAFVEPQPLWEAYTGQPWDRHRGLGWTDALHPDDREALLGRWRAARVARGPYDADGRLWHASSGTYRAFHLHAVPLPYGEGEVREWAGMVTDVDDRGRAEAALRESEARARAVLDTTVDGVVTIDERGVIEGFNPAAERTFGYNADEVVGRNLSVLMPEPYRSEHDGYLEAYRRSGVPKIIGVGRELVGRCKDGSTFPMDLAVSEVSLPDGRRVFTGFVRDITERRELEREVLRATEDERRRIGQDLHDGLGQELSTLGLFLTGLAHTLDAEGSAGAPLAHRLVDLAEGADAHARALARSLVPVEVAEDGLGAALRRMAERTAALHGVEVDVKVIGAGPARADALSPEAATNLYWIAQEALSNAVQHGRAGRARVLLAQGADDLRLRVENDGAPFQSPPRAAPAARPGRGMGLRIMHYRAHLAGGVLEIRPGATGGAVVTCTVPLRGPGFHPSPPDAPAP